MGYLRNIQIQVNEKIYLKNPESSELGKKIISGSIELIDEIGFENFNFKKLGQHISCPEASVYRYFENKHKVLLYLISWYWTWLDYKIVFATTNIDSSETKLLKALDVLTLPMVDDDRFLHIQESKLQRIVSSEASKAYLTKDVDTVNKEGLYSEYKELVSRISEIVLEINPKFPYPHMLVSTVIEGSHYQRFFIEHLPRLTDKSEGVDSVNDFYKKMVFSVILDKRFSK